MEGIKAVLGNHEKGSTNTLICVTGLTPQVITETVYALIREHQAGRDQRIPDEVRVITTTEGRDRIRASLFETNGGHGYFSHLCRDYGIDPNSIRFDEEGIQVITDTERGERSDVIDEGDNLAAADAILEAVRSATAEPGSQVHVSLAGGRKTMGFYAGYALSLHARPQDRLSHVLVNPPFESHPSFFYPPPEPTTLILPGSNDTISTAEAQVRLADLPFVRLRDELGDALDYEGLSFRESVDRAQQALKPAELCIDVEQRRVWLQGQEVRLSPTQFVWLTWFALRAYHSKPPIAFDEAALNELAGVIEWLEGEGNGPLAERVANARDELLNEGGTNYFHRNLSRLNHALSERSGLSPVLASRYRVHAFGRRPESRYALNLDAANVVIVGTP